MTSNMVFRSALACLAAVLAITGCTSSGATAAPGLSRAAATGGPFPATIALPDGIQPEGITSGPGTTFYVGSLADGRVYRGDLRTGVGEVLVEGVDGRVAVGMQFDPRRGGRLWVAGGPTGAVTVYDARTGAQLGRWVVPGSGFLNDVAVTPDAVYVTDSAVQRLVVVPLGPGGRVPGDDAATTLPLTGDITFTDGFNANGIRAVQGGQALVLVQSSTGMLFRVDPDTGAAEAIEVTGGDLVGGDGLEVVGSHLYVVRGGGGDDIAVLRLPPDGTTARFERLLTDSELDVPTTATVAAGRLWTVNARFGTPPTPTTSYQVVQVDLRP